MAYMVYVLNKDGKPLMPTKNFRKARILLKTKASVVQRTPFTIQLTTRTHNYVQEVILGMDDSNKMFGFSASYYTG